MARFFKRSVILFAIVLIVVAVFISPVLADQSSAQKAISSAKNTIKNCYESVKQAESAGANVDSLMPVLNDAAGLLSKAELAYASRDYNAAYTYATQSQSKLGNLSSQASALTVNAQANSSQNFWIVILSIVGSVGILCAGLAGWFVLGRRERRSLYGSTSV